MNELGSFKTEEHQTETDSDIPVKEYSDSAQKENKLESEKVKKSELLLTRFKSPSKKKGKKKKKIKTKDLSDSIHSAD